MGKYLCKSKCFSFEGLYTFLGQLVNFSQDPEVHYKYIQVTKGYFIALC